MNTKVQPRYEDESVTFTRLRHPGGAIGGVCVAATVTFATVGSLGFASVLLAMTGETDLWTNQSELAAGSVFFAFMIAGAVGFIVMDRLPRLGAALAILGSIVFALNLWWVFFVPVLLGVVFAIAAVKRANWFREHPARG